MARLISVSVTPTITAGAYSAGDAVGGLMTFANAGSGAMLKIISVVVIDKGDQKAALNLFLASSSFTATADNDPINISDSDAAKSIGCISIATGDYVDVGGASVATKQVGFIGYVDSSDTSLYGQLITTGTPTYASTSDLIVQLVVEVQNPQGA